MPQQGAEHGHAERSAGLAGGVQDAAGHARVPGAGRAHYRRGHGRHGQRADADADGDAHRQQQQPGGQHGLVPVGLQAERQAEQRPVQHQVEDQPDPGGAAEVPGPKQAEREDRAGLPALGPDEEVAGDQAGREQGAGQRGEPALLAGGDEARGERSQRGRPEQQAGDVGPAVRVLRRLRHVAPQHGHGQHADRHVDQEDRAPARRGDEGAAEHRAEGDPTEPIPPHTPSARARARGSGNWCTMREAVSKGSGVSAETETVTRRLRGNAGRAGTASSGGGGGWTWGSGRWLSVGVWMRAGGRGSRAELGELRGGRGQPDGGAG